MQAVFLCPFLKKEDNLMKKFEVVSKWAIPFMTVAVYILTLVVGLGWKVDIRKAVCIIVGVLFLVTGNYLPKADRIKNYKIKWYHPIITAGILFWCIMSFGGESSFLYWNF